MNGKQGSATTLKQQAKVSNKELPVETWKSQEPCGYQRKSSPIGENSHKVSESKELGMKTKRSGEPEHHKDRRVLSSTNKSLKTKW